MNNVSAYGDLALLVTDVADPAGFARAVGDARIPVLDIAIGAESVMVLLNEGRDAGPVWAALSRLSAPTQMHTGGKEVEIRVRYDGADLDAVAQHLGVEVDHVIQLHTGARFTVAFCGFAPGFAYLTGLPEELQVPRLETPRAQVPAGSVAIAAEYSGVYPRSSPGGWRLLGSTELVLFDASRNPPALLVPGDRVRFVAV